LMGSWAETIIIGRAEKAKKADRDFIELCSSK